MKYTTVQLQLLCQQQTHVEKRKQHLNTRESFAVVSERFVPAATLVGPAAKTKNREAQITTHDVFPPSGRYYLLEAILTLMNILI